MELAQDGTLIAATITMGLVAGLFYTFAQAIMPGLGRSDNRTFVAGFQAIDHAINNPWQAACFGGAPAFTTLAAALHLGAEERPLLSLTLAALVFYGATLAITFWVHVPLNNQIRATGNPDHVADLAAVRAGFEPRWIRWNLARAVLTTTAFGCLSWALLISGRP